jgi:hypothetical protein
MIVLACVGGWVRMSIHAQTCSLASEGRATRQGFQRGPRGEGRGYRERLGKGKVGA